VGNLATKGLLDFRHADGPNQLANYADYTGYVSPNAPVDLTGAFDPATVRDPNARQPLRYRDAGDALVTQEFVGAQWQHVTPFALTSSRHAALADGTSARLGVIRHPSPAPARVQRRP
jgi:hypothetical protein